MQVARTTCERGDQTQNRVVRVALGDGHVQIVQALAQDLHDLGSHFTQVVILVQ